MNRKRVESLELAPEGELETVACHQRLVKRAMAQTDCAVILLTEKVADGIRPEVERIRYECDRPLILEIPGPDGPLPGRKSLRQLAQEAVGIHVEPEKGS